MADCHLAWVPPSRDDDAWDVWITSRAALAAMATEPPCAVDSDVFLRSDFTGQLVFPGCDTTSPPGSLLGEYDNNQAQGQDLTSSVPGVDLWKGPDVLADPIEVGTSASESTTQWPFFSDDIDSFYPPPLQPEPQAAERLGQKYEEAQRGLIVASDNIPDWTLDFERDKLTVKDKKGVVDDWDRALLEMTNRSHASSVRGLQKPKRGHVNGLEMKRQPQVFEMKPVLRYFKDGRGNLQGVMKTFGAKQQVRKAFDEKSKKSTALTRLRGACQRCRSQKLRCPPGESVYELCATCQKVKPSVLKMPCLRAKIIEAALFRLGPPKDDPLRNWTKRQEVFRLTDRSDHLTLPRKLLLTQDLGVELEVSVIKFVPEPADQTSYIWQAADGVHALEMPHYYITNMDEAKKNMLEYNRRSSRLYLETLLDGSNGILWDTFQMAMRLADTGNRPLVRSALDLWAAVRLIERTWRLCGTDTLDQDPIWDPQSPWNGIIPVTPIMDTQLDQIVIQGVLQPMRDGLLKGLQNKIYESRRENWFEIYLVTFILLSNFEWMLAHTRRFAKRYGMSGRFGPRGRYSVSESYFHASKTLLAHFHFACKGSVPLSLDWRTSQASELATLDQEQVEYMETTKRRILEQEGSMRELHARHRYETDLYWGHQLFFPGWKPGQSHIEELADNAA